jgi:hypothetical protein
MEEMRYNDRRNKDIRWRDNDILGYDEYAVCCRSTKENDVYGVGFLAHRILKNYILNSEPLDERICYLQTKGRCFHTTTDQAKRKMKPLRLHFMVYLMKR